MVRLGVRLAIGLLLAFGISGGALAAGAGRPARAAATWQVRVGGGSADQALQAQAFLPSKVTINAGDTINWTFAPAHTVSFLSGGAPPALAVPGPAGLEFNPAVAFPAGGPTYDGTGYANSGLLPGAAGNTFALTFSKAGTYDYVCLLHPGMAGQVVVQAADSAYPATQAQVDAQANVEFYDKLSKAEGMLESAKVTSTPGASGRTSYAVNNGVGGNQASVLRYLPVELHVKPGDSVTWTVNDPHELHTVTFYDPAGALPMFIEPVPQAAGPPKLMIHNAAPEGGTSVQSQGLYNSGLMTPGQSYTFSFPKAGVYSYVCTIHADLGMYGKIVVDGAAAPGNQPSSQPNSLPRTGAGAESYAPLGLAAAALALLAVGVLARRRAARTVR